MFRRARLASLALTAFFATLCFPIQTDASWPAGRTAGVLDENAKSVRGAILRLGALQTTTDDAGNFVILNPPVGPNQLLFIDGGPASTPGKSFPLIPYKVTIVAGQANTLGFTPFLHFQKTTGLVDISNSSVERVVTQPELPGFVMRIPAGVTITGWDGQPNTQVSIRKVATDRNPIPPLPPGLYSPSAYMYYFGKQGGGTPSASVPITVPNDLDVPPGTQVQLWFYDEAPDGSRPNQMAQYGTGTVSADGSQIVPDINPATGQPFGQPRFCCGWFRAAIAAAFQAALNALRGGLNALPDWWNRVVGDPVDPATGLWLVQKTDMTLPGRLPIVLTRIHRGLGGAGPFGPGTSHPYHILLLIENDLRTVVLPGGARLAFPRQADGTWRNTTDPSLRGAVLTATAGHTLRFKDGSTWTFGVESSGIAFLTAQTDRHGNTLTLTRSGALGQIDAITEPSGRQLRLTHQLFGLNPQVKTITDPIGRTVTYDYFPSGLLRSVTDPAGGVTQYAYDAQNRMRSITDARGITYITTEYDSAGRVFRQTQADGGVWQFDYTTTAGIITQTVVTNPRGFKTTYRYNPQGYLLSVTDALGQTTTITRDPTTNFILATTDPLGRTTRFQYDPATGNLLKVTDPLNQETRLEYHPTSQRVTKIFDPLNQLTQLDYDPAGLLLTRITDPLAFHTDFGYNAFGQPTSSTDHLGHIGRSVYTPRGEMEQAIDPLGNVSRRTFDAVSRLVTQTDARGKTATFDYGPLNQVLSVTDPLGGTTAFSFDGNGNLLSLTDARGNALAYQYDPMDQLQRRTDPVGRSDQFTYDLNGNVRTAQDRKGQAATFTYDALDRRIRTEFSDGAVVTRTYDAAGRLVTFDDTADPFRPVRFEYDALDRLSAETSARGRVSYRYDPLNRRTEMTVAGQPPVTYTYDPNSRLRTIRQEPLTPVTLDYDELNRRTRLAMPNGVSTEYRYDEASRLRALIYRNTAGVLGDLSFQYDPVGNKTAVGGSFARTLLPDPVNSASYDAANRQLSFGGRTATHDPNGNLVTLTEPAGTTTFTWDVRDRLVGMAGPGLNAAFTYGGGRRRSKAINGRLTEALHDGPDTAQEVVDGTPVNYVSSLGVDEPLGRGESEAYVADDLGSVIALTDASGAPTTQYTYEPFGRTAATGPPSGNPFQYTARENDGTGLYYYRARYYHPGLARFIAEDPIGFAGGDINFYAYVGNSPTNFADPDGLLASLGRRIAFCAGKQAFRTLARQGLAGLAPEAAQALNNVLDFLEQIQDEQAALDFYADLVTDPTTPWYLRVPAYAAEIISAFALAERKLTGGVGEAIGPEAAALLACARSAGSGGVGAPAPGLAKRRGGETAATRTGRQKHQEFRDRVEAKPGWDPDPRGRIDPATGRTVIPDALTPSGHPVELKPDSASGRYKGQKQREAQERATGKRGRVIYYK